MKSRIIVVDDEMQSLEICERILKKKYDVRVFNKPEPVFDILDEEGADCLLTDLVMPGVDGLEFVSDLRGRFPVLPILVMSGKATVKMAVQAMKAGALDFIEKPIVDLEILPVMVEKALHSVRLMQENRMLREKLSDLRKQGFIGNSREIQKVLDIVRKVAPLTSTVLLQGETGTGKEMLARMIHDNSPRADNRFVAVNCGAVPESLLESLLFGHMKGSFSGAIRDSRGYFEEAHGGTLFLDEIGETGKSFQVKLLRVLQEKTIRKVGNDRDISVDVRIIAATNRDLNQEVLDGSFRKDLFYRLNVIRIEVPALRRRKDDISLLAIHFLNQFMQENGLQGYCIDRTVLDILKSAPWEGNIRELQNVIEHSAAMCHDGVITETDLPEYLVEGPDTTGGIEYTGLYEQAKENFDRLYFMKLLERSEGKIVTAADLSGLTRQYIYQKLKNLGVEINRE